MEPRVSLRIKKKVHSPNLTARHVQNDFIHDTNQLEITKGETTNNAENETDQCSSTSMFFRMFDIRLNETSSELFHMEQNYEDKLL